MLIQAKKFSIEMKSKKVLQFAMYSSFPPNNFTPSQLVYTHHHSWWSV